MKHNISIKNKLVVFSKIIIGLQSVLLLNSCHTSKTNLEIQEHHQQVLPDKIQNIASRSFTLETKEGHQVYFNDPNDLWATVIEKPNGTFKRAPLNLSVQKISDINLEELAKKDKITQHYKVHVRLPEHDPQGKGYIIIGDMGLKGGVKSIDIEMYEYFKAIVETYTKAGRQIKDVATLLPFIEGYTQALKEVKFNLVIVDNHPNLLNPGNIQERFIAMAKNTINKDLTLENYGFTWYDIIYQIRQQIQEQQHLPIDPSHYPSDSYRVLLSPNLDKMMPLIEEIDKLYTSSPNVIMDFNKLLGSLNIKVILEDSFHEFEKKEGPAIMAKEPEVKQLQTVSKAGLAFIGKHEGCRLETYKCPAGYPTIGFGHKINNDEKDPGKITQEGAMKLLEKDAEERSAKFLRPLLFVEANGRKVPIFLGQHKFDSLASFIYNLGPKNFETSTLRRNILGGVEYQSEGAAIITENFGRFNKAGGKVYQGLIKRRQQEADLYLYGKYN